ncbi:MAG: O-methyltransferase [Bdellovibrionaceae bacterium]|nr:O-methyltransferase [Pseudobdellovibrionaceae bacterium]
MRTEKEPRMQYIEKNFVRMGEQREKILGAILEVDKDGIQISGSEGQMIKVLAKMIGAQKVVEIGTLLGFSTTWLLEAVGPKGKVWSFEKMSEHHRIAQELLKTEVEQNRLSLHLGDAIEELPKIESEGPFDMVFIDANKAAYLDYFNWAHRNLRSGGLIVADNTFLFGMVYQDETPPNHAKAVAVMREFNQNLGEHPEYDAILIPTSEGMTIARKKSL